MSFGVDVVLGEVFTTQIELAWATSGEYDRVLVSGALQIQFLGDFLPSADTEFEIFEAASLSGRFSSMVLPNLPDDWSWDSSDLYHRGVISVITVLAILKGDVDDDGSVSNLDITLFIGLLAAAGSNATALPEPSSLACVVMVLMLGRRRFLKQWPCRGEG